MNDFVISIISRNIWFLTEYISRILCTQQHVLSLYFANTSQWLEFLLGAIHSSMAHENAAFDFTPTSTWCHGVKLVVLPACMIVASR
mmetsp:Transcript_60568/g.107298  ORF Transcript_60568/g.107298 Transcript_60568/m.107298 type:complete len:87 (-) Transcript_60568:165-425(-)